MVDSTWHPTAAVAWTEHDGPGRSPAGPSRALLAATALALSAGLAGILLTDTLCPEHRAWAQSLGAASIVAVIGGLVLLSRRSAAAPVLVLAASLGGVAIGIIDAAHAPGRGMAIALGFGTAALLGFAATGFALRAVIWSRHATRAMATSSPPRAEWALAGRPASTGPDASSSAPAPLPADVPIPH